MALFCVEFDVHVGRMRLSYDPQLSSSANARELEAQSMPEPSERV